MNDSPQVTVRRVVWSAAREELRAIRIDVFVREQHVPEALEWDAIDEECLHVLARTAAGDAIGTGRLLPDGHIGRMAVLAQWRGRGVGARLLAELIAAATERGYAEVELSAQTHAIGFYRRCGFEVVSGEYLDAGIPHRSMRRVLVRPPPG
ncbi:MAG: GNAT family N-acetyltransferase [Betaproteobacteria bacterium]